MLLNDFYVSLTIAVTLEPLLTPAQIADELHVTVATVRRWISTGDLRAAKAGPRLWTVRRSDLDRFLGAGGSGEAGPADPTEDPTFISHLVAPGER